MKLSQSVTYGVHAALRLALAQGRAPISCGQLAASGKMPERFLLQILRDLSRQGILQSSRGGGGGFMLDRSPQEISLLDIVEAIDGPIHGSLPANIDFPPESLEILRQTLERVTEQTRRHLASIRLADLLGPAPSMMAPASPPSDTPTPS